MKKIVTIVAFITNCLLTLSCKKDQITTAPVAEAEHAVSTGKPNCFSSCPQPVGTATVVINPIIAPVNHLPKVRLSVFYYFQSNKKGTFNVSIKNQSQTISLGQFNIQHVPSSPLDGSPGLIEKDFIFPVALNAYPGYSIIVNGQSDCSVNCSSFTGYFIP